MQKDSSCFQLGNPTPQTFIARSVNPEFSHVLSIENFSQTMSRLIMLLPSSAMSFLSTRRRGGQTFI